MAASRLSITRLIWRALVLLLLALLCIVLAVASYFGTARFVDGPAAAGAIAALALVAATFACCWWRAPGLGISTQRRSASSWAGASLVLASVALLASRFVFLPIDAAQAVPMGTIRSQSWELPTGSTIAYSRVAAKSHARASPVIYLHGGPAVPPRSSIGGFLAPLADHGFDVYLYDQFGSGASSRASDIAEYTVQRHVADLEAIRRQLGADRIVLVGSSWGAVLAGYYMAAYPAHVERAVLLSPGVLTRRAEHPYDFSRTASSDDQSVIVPPLRMVIAGALARLNPKHAQAFASQEELGRAFDRFTTGGSLEFQSRCKGRVDHDATAKTSTRAVGGNYYANLLTLQSLRQAPDPRPRLQAVTAPVLLLRGDCDYVPLSSSLAWREALPNATLVRLPDAGHALTSEAREAAYTALRSFLVEGPAPPPT